MFKKILFISKISLEYCSNLLLNKNVSIYLSSTHDRINIDNSKPLIVRLTHQFPTELFQGQPFAVSFWPDFAFLVVVFKALGYFVLITLPSAHQFNTPIKRSNEIIIETMVTSNQSVFYESNCN